jgi:WD40 repeat protein
VVIWNPETAKVVRSWKAHSSGVTTVAVSNDGYKLFSGSYDKTIRIWDLTNTGKFRSLNAESEIRCLILSADERRLYAGDELGNVQIWDLFAEKQLAVLSGHADESVTQVSLSRDGQRLCSSSWGRVVIWDLEASRQTLVFEPGGDALLAGEKLIHGDPDGSITIIDLSPPASQRTLELPPTAGLF